MQRPKLLDGRQINSSMPIYFCTCRPYFCSCRRDLMARGPPPPPSSPTLPDTSLLHSSLHTAIILNNRYMSITRIKAPD